jgi:hypothetical protein
VKALLRRQLDVSAVAEDLHACRLQLLRQPDLRESDAGRRTPNRERGKVWEAANQQGEGATRMTAG